MSTHLGMLDARSVLVTLLSVAPLQAKTAPPTADLEAFCQSDWSAVSGAMVRLAAHEDAAIPELVKMVFRRDRVPLTDTADLIYPGAKTFYGHGMLIDYDLDYLAARAGWLLERIAFEDFGFSAGSLSEARLFDAVRRGKRDVPLRDAVPQPVGPRDFAPSAEKARAWWASNAATWTKLGAAKAALGSTNGKRQMMALEWLRGGESQCEHALSSETCRLELAPLVKQLAANGSAGIREQASLVLRDRAWRSPKLGPRKSPR